LGSPQEGFLYPFLWIILIDDILRTTFSIPFIILAFADDLTIATSHLDPVQAVHNNLQTISMLLIRFCVISSSIYTPKTVLFVFSKRKIKLPPVFLTVNGSLIHPSQKTSFLRLIIDLHLKGTKHIKAKYTSEKRALFSINSCIRISLGADQN
jgi:hypothetical protein